MGLACIAVVVTYYITSLLCHPISDCVLFFQALSATLNGKKTEVGPWIDILTSRDSDHLNKGEAVTYLSNLCVFLVHLFLYIRVHSPDLVCGLSVSHSADGTGAEHRAVGGSGSGEKVFGRHSTGFESFR